MELPKNVLLSAFIVCRPLQRNPAVRRRTEAPVAFFALTCVRVCVRALVSRVHPQTMQTNDAPRYTFPRALFLVHVVPSARIPFQSQGICGSFRPIRGLRNYCHYNHRVCCIFALRARARYFHGKSTQCDDVAKQSLQPSSAG